MTNVHFAVSFRLEKEEAAERTLEDAIRSSGSNETAERERREGEEEEEERIETGTIGGAWVEGIAHSYDVRNKVLYIDTIDLESRPRTIAGAPACSTTGNSGIADKESVAASARTQLADEGQFGRIGTEGGKRRHGCARHVLDVRLPSCSSPQGEELFDQLQAFSRAFKTGLARASLDLAVDAAADLGALCRLILGGFVVEILGEEIATEACRDERLAVAAERTATAAIGSVLRAAQRAVMLARRFASGRTAYRRKQSSAATNNNAETGKENLHHTRAPNSSSFHETANGVGDTSPRQYAADVDKSVAARMCFRCTTIVSERRRKALRNASAAAVSGVGVEGAAPLSSDVVDRRRHDLQYLARWT